MQKNKFSNRLWSLVLVLTVMLCSMAIPAAAAEPDGTLENPYRIGTPEALAALADIDEPIGYVVLTDDIDMSELADWSAPTCIIKNLTGGFDGKGFTISNLELSGGTGSYSWSDGANPVNTGLIGTLSGTVQNAILENVSITEGIGGDNNVGTFAGQIAEGSSGRIVNCIANGTISATDGNSRTYIGGLVGYIFGTVDTNSSLTVTGCIGNVSVTCGRSGYAGGLIGCASGYSNLTVSKCAALRDVLGSSAYRAGILGNWMSRDLTLSLSDSYFAGNAAYGIACNSRYTTASVTAEGFYYNSAISNLVHERTDQPTGAEGLDTDGLKNLSIDGFAVQSGKYDEFPVPIWNPAEPLTPEVPQFSCTVSFRGTEDGTVSLFKDGEPISASDGVYTLTEKGEYTYTVTEFEDYDDITDGSFTVGDGDNEGEKIIWVHPVYKTVPLTGEGTEESPYVISSAKELCTLANRINNGDDAESYVKLDSDISFNGSWTPLGKNSVYAFRGSFDGNNHSVTVTVDNPKLSYFGFFGCITDAEVKNLTVNGEIYCSSTAAYVGGLTGRARGNVLIENCTNNATVSAKVSSYIGIGGLVGGYDDNIEYKWENIRLLVKDSTNRGLIVASGSGSNAYAGGIVGSNANCAELINCESLGTISAQGIWLGGLLGQSGSRMGDCHPSLTDCTVSAVLIGTPDKTNRLYGKGSLAAKYITDSGDNTYDGGSTTDNALLLEAAKYADVIAASSSASVGDNLTLLKDGETAGDSISLSCSQNEEDKELSYLSCTENGISLAKLNTTGKAVEATATLRLADENGNALRKPITVNIYPSETGSTETARQRLMNNIAASYSGKSGDWVVFDMAAYELLGFGANTTNRENYLNLTVNALAGNSALVTDRAKAEIILSALGVDSTQLTPFEGDPFNNAEKLQSMNLGSSHYSAPWVLLAEEAGKLELTDGQRSKMISLLLDKQSENGLFQSVWGGEKYDDADTTATALAALARFCAENDDVRNFADKALIGLSNAQGANGSFGNANSDAMVIIGLAAMGIDPETDSRFVKCGCSLADALMLYVNDSSNGFTASFSADSQGEKAQALATEQGFRALITLEQLKKSGSGSFNIYTMETSDGTPVITPAPSEIFVSSGEGNVELPDDVHISSDGETSGNSNITVSLSVLSDKSLEWLSTGVTMPKGATVADVLKKAFSDAGISAAGLDNGYISSVTYGDITLSQCDNGPNSGWMYKVNGTAPKNTGISDYKLKSGDSITLYYTNDYTTEEETKSWGGGHGSSGSNTADTPKDDTPSAEENTDTPKTDGKSLENITDVGTDAWYFDAVRYVIEGKLMKGISEKEFAPEANLTRAMFVTILHRAENEPEAQGKVFSDVPNGDWFSNAVAWASSFGIVSGISDTEFAPDDNITREQMAVIMFRYAKYKGVDVSVGEDTNILSYSDSDEISDYAAEALQWTAGSGIMSGKSSTTLNPLDNATRAETAAVIMRFIEAIK